MSSERGLVSARKERSDVKKALGRSKRILARYLAKRFDKDAAFVAGYENLLHKWKKRNEIIFLSAND